MKSSCLFVAALSLLPTSGPAQSPNAPQAAAGTLLAGFDAAGAERDTRATMARGRIPGAQVVVVGPSGIVWRQAFGVADLETGRRMDFDTLLQIGSVTKIFTASILADMVARHEIGWSDTLAQVLPGVPMRADIARISLGELVSHTSRLPANPPNRVDVDGTWRPYSRAELSAALADSSFALGDAEWNYSNFGFAILGHVIERVSGKSYEEVVRERIFVPLGMNHSHLRLGDADEPRLASHYWPEDNPLRRRPRWRFGEIAGFGGIATTADDLSAFLAYQMNPASRPGILNARAISEMRTIRIMFPDWRIGVGRPWFERRDADGTLTVEHGGEVDGHSAMMMFSPGQNVGVVVLANMGQSAAEDIARPLLARIVAAARLQTSTRSQADRFYQSRQWADAEAAYASLSAGQADGEIWFRLGRARYELRDAAGARAALERAAALPRHPAHAFLYLAAIAAQQLRIDDAFAALGSALESGNPLQLIVSRREFNILKGDPRWQSLLNGARPPAQARPSN